MSGVERESAMRLDERAAGVISGTDPYRELEQYLEKVQEELGEAFEKWPERKGHRKKSVEGLQRDLLKNGHPPITGYSPTLPPSEPPPPSLPRLVGHHPLPRPHPPLSRLEERRSKKYLLLNCKSSSLPVRKKRGPQTESSQLQFDFDKQVEAWSNLLLADVQSIVENELKNSSVTGTVTSATSSGEETEPDYDEVYVTSDEEEDEVSVECGGVNMRYKTSSSPGRRNLSPSLSPSPSPSPSPSMSPTVSPSSTSDVSTSSSSGSGGSNGGSIGLTVVGGCGGGGGGRKQSAGIGIGIGDTSPRHLHGMGRNRAHFPVVTLPSPKDGLGDSPIKGIGVSQRTGRPKLTSGTGTLLSAPPSSRSGAQYADKSRTLPKTLPSFLHSSGGGGGLSHRTGSASVGDAETQTSPTVSRSSSSTWLSEDCSELSSADDYSTVNRDRDRDEVESGIGTASPTPHRIKNKSPVGQKCRRKETWERLRRRGSGVKHNFLNLPRGDVWVRREGYNDSPTRSTANSSIVESSSDPDLLHPRPSRPKGPSRPLCLPLGPTPSPLSSSEALPSPTSASLKLSAEPLAPELCSKSSSAPLLMKTGTTTSGVSNHSDESTKKRVMKQPRSQSEKQLSEIEASEACKWLRAAGFPQYAQMYQDLQFPIDVNGVQKDHPFLDSDALQSLFRRLHALNRCANMKLDYLRKRAVEDSDSDGAEGCALSDNWTFQPESRRWSRVCDVQPLSQASQNPAVVRFGSMPQACLALDSELLAAKFKRSGSERLRDSARALLRRVKSRKHRHREGLTISTPQVVDVANMQQRVKNLNCFDVTPPNTPSTDFPHPIRGINDDQSTLSDSDVSWKESVFKDANSNHTEMFDLLSVPKRDREASPVNQNLEDLDNNEFSSTIQESDSDVSSKQRPGGASSVVRWHSFQRGSVRPNSIVGQPINTLTAGQLLVLRKLALLRLTATMEKHCPSHRTNWNWELPKFIKKVKTPDYKDKNVFGVPLSVCVQRCGDPLPQCIQHALSWLRMNALDQVGLFRKSGVRSRIQKLKTQAETNTMDLEGQQAYDVADMLKQYFRELPDSLLTNKLSETFIAIFQYVPANLRHETAQCALLLLPDEHREALYTMLDFLQCVGDHSNVNQMTISNLALVFAPSLLHAPLTMASRRRQPPSSGMPDAKQLSQNKAAHDCLLYLIKYHCQLFMVSEDVLGQCHFSALDASVPITINELGAELGQDWRGYLATCIQALMREAREKNRGWVTVMNEDKIDVAFKKVGDGHALRVWRVSIEVEAPPAELLHRVLRERHLWDPALSGYKVVSRLDATAELIHFLRTSMPPHPPRDYSIIRSWRRDIGRGGCAVAETSVEHEGAALTPGSVRAISLASRYLIEPCGSGRSRILHLSRVDTRGRTPDWYNRNYGHLCAQYLMKIRNSFHQTTEGPESKV